MTQISFARGMPGPDLLPIAAFGDCAREALERDGATALQTARPVVTRRSSEWVAEQHGIDPWRASSSRTGRSRASRSRRATSCSRARASSWRRPATTARSRSSASSAPRWSRWSSPTTASTSMRSQSRSAKRGPTSSTRSRLSRTRAGARSPRTAGASSTSRLDRAATVFEDDPVRDAPLRGRVDPAPFELSGGTTSSSSRRSRRPSRRASAPATSSFRRSSCPRSRSSSFQNYVSPAIFVEAALLEFLTSGRFEPNLETVRDGLRLRRDAMLAALSREMPEAPSLESARGRLLPLARPAERAYRPKLFSPEQERRTSSSSRAPTSSSTAAGNRRGSRSPSPPHARSTRASPGSDGSCARRLPLQPDTAPGPYRPPGRARRSPARASRFPCASRLGSRASGSTPTRHSPTAASVIEEHDELSAGAGRHEELYFVARGHAASPSTARRSTRRPGTLRLRPRPARAARRRAAEPGTTVLVVGGTRGEGFPGLSVGVLARGAALLHGEGHERGTEIWAGPRAASGEPERPLQPRLLRGARRPRGRTRSSTSPRPRRRSAPAGLARTDSDFDSIRRKPALPGAQP